MSTISWSQFEAIDIRVGTIIEALDFAEAKKPAYKLKIDLGPELGIKTSSAQLTARYTKEALLHRQVICVCNFPVKQIGPFQSEVLVTGFYHDDKVILAQPDSQVDNGAKLA